MAYILKNNNALLNSKFTDTGRQKLSKGKLNITYFQVGDSEIAYGVIPGYNHTQNYILQAEFNAQNSSYPPETNKMNVKYPFYLNNSSGTTYGLAIQDSQIFPIFSKAAPLGFFSGGTGPWSAFTDSGHTLNPNYVIDLCLCNGANIVLQDPNCINYEFAANNSLGGSIEYLDCDGVLQTEVFQGINLGPVQRCASTIIRQQNATVTNIGQCDSNLCDECAIAQPSVGDIAVIYFGDCSCGVITYGLPILVYNVVAVNMPIITLDRPIPNYLDSGCCGCARVFFYPSQVSYYDPNSTDCLTDLCGCNDPNSIVKVWNLSIPWSVSPAGVISSLNEDYTKYASAPYLGSKEYFGYQEISGQTFSTPTSSALTTDTYYYDSLDQKVYVQPYEQKAIGIVHYTNNSQCNYYGEKFAMNPFDPTATSDTGSARNFKISLPWLMWHKSSDCTIGQTFYVDPQIGSSDYFEVHYMQSKPNPDMNEPGLRYFTLWDINLNQDGNPSRVGKVFPDLKTIVFDDEEIVAAMSYKSNRNWTLPAPHLTTALPNLNDTNPDDTGVLGDSTEYMYITYRFNSSAFTNSLHCNYYVKIQGKDGSRQDVNVSFGNEFCFLRSCDCCFNGGYTADEFIILAQIVTGATSQPLPDQWRYIDFTQQVLTVVENCQSGTTECVTPSEMANNVFTIRHDQYFSAPIYNLDDFIDLPAVSGEENYLQFGDETFFYGVVETDIAATIYEMNYLVNLQASQFTNSSNPLWKPGTKNYITEIGLFDDEKDLIIITKLQNPIVRQGVQQFAIKMDF